ncbi:MAG: helix-turn-helix transcriptional regulator [Steroidobacteraceae bacterium]|nr:helix-turn-helix transcriptional regulator [Steroidobacteraceae bacterium]
MERTRTFGEQLREWRQRRHLSQLELATDLDISTRHLSFVETGRSLPSRAMVLRLAERLNIPLRERNALLTAAGYAPMYATKPLSDPSMTAARAAVDLILNGHEPYPALLVDRHWTLLGHNRAVAPFLAQVDPSLLAPPVNTLRLTLHPQGLAPHIENLAQWRAHLLARVSRDLELTADRALADLLSELRSYGGEHDEGHLPGNGDFEYPGVVVPLKLRTPHGVLTMFSTTTVFGTPVEVTLSELMLEALYPADEFTAEMLRKMASGASIAKEASDAVREA